MLSTIKEAIMKTIKPRTKHLHQALMSKKPGAHKDARRPSRAQLKQALRKEV
jgi:hypothetical protein